MTSKRDGSLPAIVDAAPGLGIRHWRHEHARDRGGGSGLGIGRWVRRRYAVESGAAAIETVRTDDGWWVALARYPRTGGPLRRHPVVLCPGLASNRTVFDLHPERSLARYLAAQGFSVYVLELRGHGYAARPSRLAPWRWRWSLDTYLHHDVPAAIEAVRARTGASALHWIGHSMGGILLYAALARDPGLPIRAGITVGSALDYSVDRSDYHAVRRVEWLLTALPYVPANALSTWTAPLAGRWGTVTDRFNAHPDNVEPALFRRLQAHAFHDVPAPVLRQLSTGFLPGGLRDAQGRTRYLDGLPAVPIPILALAGTDDRQCPPPTAFHTADALPRSERRAFGRAHGHPTEYGHFDLLMGPRASREVWPTMLEWLQAHD